MKCLKKIFIRKDVYTLGGSVGDVLYVSVPIDDKYACDRCDLQSVCNITKDDECPVLNDSEVWMELFSGVNFIGSGTSVGKLREYLGIKELPGE